MTGTNLNTLAHEAATFTLDILNVLQPYAVYITLGFLLVACPTLLFLILKGSVVPVEDTVEIANPNDPMTVYLKDLSTQIYRYHNEAKRDFLHLTQRLSSMEAEIQSLNLSQPSSRSSRSRNATAKLDLPKLESALLQLRKEMGAHTCLLRDEIVNTLNQPNRNR